jgi:hypothetical protein
VVSNNGETIDKAYLWDYHPSTIRLRELTLKHFGDKAHDYYRQYSFPAVPDAKKYI